MSDDKAIELAGTFNDALLELIEYAVKNHEGTPEQITLLESLTNVIRIVSDKMPTKIIKAFNNQIAPYVDLQEGGGDEFYVLACPRIKYLQNLPGIVGDEWTAIKNKRFKRNVRMHVMRLFDYCDQWRELNGLELPEQWSPPRTQEQNDQAEMQAMFQQVLGSPELLQQAMAMTGLPQGTAMPPPGQIAQMLNGMMGMNIAPPKTQAITEVAPVEQVATEEGTGEEGKPSPEEVREKIQQMTGQMLPMVMKLFNGKNRGSGDVTGIFQTIKDNAEGFRAMVPPQHSGRFDMFMLMIDELPGVMQRTQERVPEWFGSEEQMKGGGRRTKKKHNEWALATWDAVFEDEQSSLFQLVYGLFGENEEKIPTVRQALTRLLLVRELLSESHVPDSDPILQLLHFLYHALEKMKTTLGTENKITFDLIREHIGELTWIVDREMKKNEFSLPLNDLMSLYFSSPLAQSLSSAVTGMGSMGAASSDPFSAKKQAAVKLDMAKLYGIVRGEVDDGVEEEWD